MRDATGAHANVLRSAFLSTSIESANTDLGGFPPARSSPEHSIPGWVPTPGGHHQLVLGTPVSRFRMHTCLHSRFRCRAADRGREIPNRLFILPPNRGHHSRRTKPSQTGKSLTTRFGLESTLLPAGTARGARLFGSRRYSLGKGNGKANGKPVRALTPGAHLPDWPVVWLWRLVTLPAP